jgi:hypothetical protein
LWLSMSDPVHRIVHLTVCNWDNGLRLAAL